MSFLLGFSGNLAGRHSCWILSLLWKSSKKKTIFKSPPNCRNRKTRCAEPRFWEELVEKNASRCEIATATSTKLRKRKKKEKQQHWGRKLRGKGPKGQLQNQRTKKTLPQWHCYDLFWLVMTRSGENIAQKKTGLLWLCSDCSDLTSTLVCVLLLALEL